MKQLFRTNLSFFIPHLLFLVISIVFITLYSKAEIHIFLNSLHAPLFDQFFKLITYLGDGMIYLFVLAFLLMRKYKWAIAFVGAVVISNVVVYVFKHVVFSEMYRPSRYFELYENYKLYLVNGVRLHNLNSFPSGHTTTAFTIFFTVALIARNHSIKVLCFIVSLLTGYSRIYLSQHFLVDVVVGSVFGVGAVLLAFYYSKYLDKTWMEKSVFAKSKKARNADSPITKQTPGVAVQ